MRSYIPHGVTPVATVPFPPILQPGKQSQTSLVIREGVGCHAQITSQVPEIVTANVAIGSRKTVLSAHGRPLRRSSLRAQKIVICETTSPDGPIPEGSADIYLVLQPHPACNLGHVRAGIFIFQFGTGIPEIGLKAGRVVAPDRLTLAEPLGYFEIDLRNP